MSTETPTRDLPTPDPTGDGSSSVATPGLAWLLAGLMAGAGVVHLAMAPAHAGGDLIDPLGFALAGWFQLGIAAMVLAGRARRGTFMAAAVGNAVLIGAWAWSRTWGLPVGSHAFEPEQVGGIDLLTVALQAVGIVVAAALVVSPRAAASRLTPMVAGLAAVAVLGAATAAVVSPDAAGHSHAGGEAAAGGGHDHGGADMAAEMAAIDAARCDLGFNTSAYYAETAILGIDTYGGGAMAHDDHSLVGTIATADPLGGRGSAQLDKLVGLSTKATSESAAGAVVAELGNATEPEYQAWLQWLKASGAVGHDHDAAAPDDNAGHGGHLGPQGWVAMVDQTQCERLTNELEVARATALAYPTAADATAAGYFKVTNYLPGIAAHYMKFAYVDGAFEITEPEMLLYDGNGPDASIVGLSYYVLLDGEAEPTQGFTGANDHYHRHVGLCIRGGLVVGDTTTTEEECTARGGVKSSGSAGWMSHAWVVPGCESPWGLFSAANPILDGALSQASGTDGGGCAGSGVRARYDLNPGRPGGELAGTGVATEEARGD
jgi:hypothetical protein